MIENKKIEQSGQKVEILIVDDEISSLDLLDSFLKNEDYIIRTTISGSLAQKSLKIKKPDLILLDVNLKDIKGFELCEKIRTNSNYSDIPIIFISSANDEDTILKGFELGAIDYITKPFRKSEVLARIKTHLKLKKLNEDLIFKNDELQEEISKYLNIFDALRESNTFYKLLADNMEDVIWKMDADTLKFTFVSPSIFKLRGITVEEALQEDFQDTLEQENIMEIMDLISKIKEVKNPFDLKNYPNKFTLKQKTKAGKTIDVEMVISIIFDEHNNIKEFLGVSRDVSERERYLTELKENEKKYSQVMNAVNDGIWEWNVQTGEAEFSENYYKLLAYDDKEFTANYKNWRILVHPDDIMRVEDELKFAVSKGIGFEIDLRMKTKTNEWLWVMTRGKAIEFDENGNALIMVGTLSNIVKRKTVEEELYIIHQRLESMIRILQNKMDNIDEFLNFVLNEAISLTNSKIGYIFNYSEETKIFDLNNWSKNVMAECNVSNPRFIYNLDDTGLWGEPVRQRKPIIVNDFSIDIPFAKGAPLGHVKLNRYLSIPVLKNDKIVAVVGLANKDTDYTLSDVLQITLLMEVAINSVEIKQNDKSIVEHRKELLVLNETKDKLLSILAHDLRSPFNTIIGFTDILLNDYEKIDDDEFLKLLKLIKQSSTNTYNLLDNLLIWVKAQFKGMQAVKQEVNIKEIVDSIRLTSDYHAIKKEITIIDQIANNINVYVDRDMIFTVFRNIINNAVKYTPHNGTIRFNYSEDETYYYIKVLDTGKGIPHDILENLFNIKYSYSTPGTDNEKGTGLGLLLSKELIELNNGKIIAKSIENKGSEFIIQLPKIIK